MRKIARVLLAFGIVAVLLIAAGRAAATTTTFTSTADFDTGTKSDPGDGNYGVETVSDNGAIPSGQIQLSNIAGDEFTHTDGNGVTFKWTTKSIGSGSSNCAYQITGGYYQISEPDNTGVEECAGVAASSISGSFDIRIKLSFQAGNVKLYGFCVMSTQECSRGLAASYSGSANGIFYDRIFNTLQPAKVVAGTTTFIGTTTTVTSEPLWMRISRSGDDYTFYYSSDGSSWTTDETDTVTSITGAKYSGFYSTHNGGAYGATELRGDSFQMTAGTVDSGGYRTSGDWISASQSAITHEVFTQITIDYSGATGSNYVTAISLFDSSNHYFFIDNIDLTSGSFHIYTLSIGTSLAWKVRVNLTGGNAGSVSILDIVITHHTNTAPVITSTGDDSNRFGKLYLRTITFMDSDGDSMTWSLVTNNSDLSIGSSNGTIYGTTWVPGLYYVNVTASDGFGGSDFFNYTLTVLDVNVYIAPVPSVIGGTVSFATDTDYDQPWTCSWSFGDGFHSSDCDATHIYSTSGTFSGSLVVTHGSESGTVDFSTRVLPTPNPRDVAILLVLGILWLLGAVIGTVMRTGLIVILSGLAGLGFTVIYWFAVEDFISTGILFASACLTLAWAGLRERQERTP